MQTIEERKSLIFCLLINQSIYEGYFSGSGGGIKIEPILKNSFSLLMQNLLLILAISKWLQLFPFLQTLKLNIEIQRRSKNIFGTIVFKTASNIMLLKPYITVLDHNIAFTFRKYVKTMWIMNLIKMTLARYVHFRHCTLLC